MKNYLFSIRESKEINMKKEKILLNLKEGL